MTNLQNRILGYVYKKPCTIADIQSKFKLSYEAFSRLTGKPFNTYTIIDSNADYDAQMVSASITGEDYIQNLRRERRRFLFPNIISIAAILTAIVSIILQAN